MVGWNKTFSLRKGAKCVPIRTATSSYGDGGGRAGPLFGFKRIRKNPKKGLALDACFGPAGIGPLSGRWPSQQPRTLVLGLRPIRTFVIYCAVERERLARGGGLAGVLSPILPSTFLATRAEPCEERLVPFLSVQ